MFTRAGASHKCGALGRRSNLSTGLTTRCFALDDSQRNSAGVHSRGGHHFYAIFFQIMALLRSVLGALRCLRRGDTGGPQPPNPRAALQGTQPDGRPRPHFFLSYPSFISWRTHRVRPPDFPSGSASSVLVAVLCFTARPADDGRQVMRCVGNPGGAWGTRAVRGEPGRCVGNSGELYWELLGSPLARSKQKILFGFFLLFLLFFK